MTFCLHVHSGLNNKLVPLLGLLRIAKKENRKVKCLWGNDAYINRVLFTFNDLFESIDNLELITIEEYMNLFNNQNNKIYNKSGSDRDRSGVIYTNNDKNEMVLFHKVVHLISYQDDNAVGNALGNYVPYPREIKEIKPIISELREIAKLLKPVEKIQTRINSTIENFKDNNVIGLHIRTTDGGFTDIPSKDVFGFIKNMIHENHGSKIYISCDTLALENEIKKTFPNNILYFTNPFGDTYSEKYNRSSWGTMNALCEMFILSKCDKFYGTPGSSLSFMVWLLRNDKLLDFWCKNPWN